MQASTASASATDILTQQASVFAVVVPLCLTCHATVEALLCR